MCTVPLPGGLMTVIRVAESAVIFAATLAELTLAELTLAASDRPVPVIRVAESVRSFAATLPKLTLVAPDRPVPVIVTVVPPAVVPLAGEIPVIAGSDEPGCDEPGGEDDGGTEGCTVRCWFGALEPFKPMARHAPPIPTPTPPPP